MNGVKIDKNIVVRNKTIEKQIGIKDLNLFLVLDDINWLEIYGEIIADMINTTFYIKCTVYDDDNDIVATEESDFIYLDEYFNKYPFKMFPSIPNTTKIKQVKIEPVIVAR